ncbi:MAG: hypothetical protein A2Z30_04020 [Chloroflexi bacterium RBG_16_64_43]|nr:MAG: hypothetical protein A2Z30_04020 [Chloroflexi bacterium RBG_16_64_43]
MNLASYLATAKVFGGLLDQLASPTPDAELLEDAGLATSPALRAFAARTWAADRRRTTVGGAQDLVLLVAYQTTLHIEQVRYRYPPRVLRGALIFLARSVWPAYEVWVADGRPLGTRSSIRSSLTWLTADGMLGGALRELGVPKPEGLEFRLSARDFDGCESRHYHWFKLARLEVYARVKEAMGATTGEGIANWRASADRAVQASDKGEPDVEREG